MAYNFNKYRKILIGNLTILFIITISGCGDPDYSADGFNRDDTGGIIFNVLWEGAPTREDSLNTIRAVDCNAAGISTVTFEVYNDNNQLLASESFQCALGTGTVDNVPAGTNRKLTVSGKNVSEAVIYYGERTGITVTAGADTEVGEIVCNPINCTDSDLDNYYVESECGILVDCNDNDDTIHPLATEICGDDIDQDCNGSDLICDNYFPEVNILSPEEASTFSEGYMIHFVGSAYDNEDGTLTNSSLVWRSNKDGELGVGTEISIDSLTVGWHFIRFEATDSEGAMSFTGINVNIKENSVPVSDAGMSIIVRTGSLVTLDGSQSSDADMDTLYYTWTISEVPTGSAATLSNVNAVFPTFIADLAGVYSCQLIVNDGLIDSDPTFVAITAIENQPTLFSENFENGLGLWNADNGIWEVGEPTSGPGSAFSSLNVAATVLNGDYPNNNSRFISPSILIPTITSDEEVHFRFWHWFNFASSDSGRVQVSEELSPGVWSNWKTLESDSSSCGGVWSYQLADLTAYGGKKIKVGFFLENGMGEWTSSGWYIDDILVSIENVYDMKVSGNYSEGFEQGVGSWRMDNGIWEIGSPTSGPNAAYTGSNVAATILDGAYANVDARLFSPSIVVPPLAINESLYLRFWHWFSVASSDSIRLEIREQLSPGVWSNRVSLESYTSSSGGIWTYPLIDLSAYADRKIQIVFYLDQGMGSHTANGWYIDDIAILVEP